MFEKFTEPARRVIFFARYEASQYGSPTIETEHFLLGLIREDMPLLRRVLPDSSAIDIIRERVNQQVEIRTKTSTSIDIPLSEECKHILGCAVEEGELVGTGQLLLGILREENSRAAKILTGLGVHIVVVRGQVSQASAAEPGVMHLRSLHRHESIPGTPLPVAGVVPDADTAKRIAEAVWMQRVSPRTGESVEAQTATLTFDVWIVIGSHTAEDRPATALAAFIQKEDGKILRCT
jgi:hypothetical protein